MNLIESEVKTVNEENKTATTGNSYGDIDNFFKLMKIKKTTTKEELTSLLHQCQVMRTEAKDGVVKMILGAEYSKKLLDVIDEAEPEILRQITSMD